MEFYPTQASASTSRSIYDHDYPMTLARRNHIAASLGAPGYTIEQARQFRLAAPTVQHDLLSHSIQNSQIQFHSQPATQYPQALRYSSAVPQAAPSSSGLQRRAYPFIAPTSFSPYHPNEVKHRKRTTRPQQKLLEHTFRNETDKPDAALRNTLAAKLGMTSRNVQVWFQNRRAKEKKLKATAAQVGSEEKDNAEATTEEADEAAEGSISRPSTADAYAPLSASTATAIPTTPKNASASSISFEPIAMPTVPAISATSTINRANVPAPIATSAAQVQSTVANFSQGVYSSDPFVHRGSVPIIRTPSSALESQHQRSSSSPTFPVAPPSTNAPQPLTIQAVPKTMYNYSNYPAQQSASTFVFPRAYQAPLTGPLPDAAYSFGNPQQLNGSDSEHEDEQLAVPATSNTRFGSIASVSGSESASLSGFSFFAGSDATSASEGIYHVEEESSASRPEQGRTSTSDSSQTLHVAPMTDGVPMSAMSSGYSYTPPYSIASYSSGCSPPSAGIATSLSGSSPHQIGVATELSYVGDVQYAAVPLQNYEEPKKDSNVAAINAMYAYNVGNGAIYGSHDVHSISPANSFTGLSVESDRALLQGYVGNYTPSQYTADSGMSQNVTTHYAQPMEAQYAYNDYNASFYGAQYGTYQH